MNTRRLLDSPRNLKSCFTNRLDRKSRTKGLTIMELIVMVAVTGVLATSGAVAYSSALSKGAMTRELAAGKTLIQAYSLYATENNGELMPGFDKFADSATLTSGQEISDGEVKGRYPWRLAPYFGHKMDGVILVNENKRQIKDLPTAPKAGYYESLLPAFGMNATYVGGYIEESPGKMTLDAGEVAQRMVQVQKPGSLLVFATAKNEDSHGKFSGYFRVAAPRWVPRAPGQSVANTDWPQNGTPEATGFLDARHNGKVLCAFLDGSVRAYSTDELKGDMRLWSKNAVVDDNPSYAPTLAGGSTGGGRGR